MPYISEALHLTVGKAKKPYTLSRPLTPLKTRSPESEGRVMPQSFPVTSTDSPKNLEIGLRTYTSPQGHTIEFAYLNNLEEIKDTGQGINEAKFVKLAGKEYVYKSNIVSAEHLPKNHERAILEKSFSINPDKQYHFYNSNSRIMMQIMSRDLLELFVKDRDDVILPKIYPVVHVVDKENSEVCGMITEKIDFQEVFIKKLSIERKIKENAIPSLMKILGIEGIIYGSYIKNVGFMKPNPKDKLVFFDFGNNLIDNEFISRNDTIDLEDIKLENTVFSHSLKDTREKYLLDYKTTNDDNGLAKTIHHDIENIIMTKGPGDEESRKEMAKIMQTRINNAFIL